MRQIDLVRENSDKKKFEAAVETALDRARHDPRTAEADVAGDDLEEATEVLRGALPSARIDTPKKAEASFMAEAIILEELRPAWFIKDDAIEIGGNYDRIDLVRNNQAELNETARRVGRVDLIFHPTLDYAGTGWLLADDIAVTNRHVAQVFASGDGFGRWDFAQGAFDRKMEARLDFLHQFAQDDSARRRADVVEVLYIAGPEEPDFAFVRVVPPAGMEPVEFSDRLVEPGQPIAAIGYPAWDGRRNDPQLMEQLFGGIYGVKRFSPGLARASSRRHVFESDYTSLGGNSGSAVIDIATGKALGLHFAGLFRDTNYAVEAPIVQAALRRITTQVAVPLEGPSADPVSSPESLADRAGYQADFLGPELEVALPGFGEWQDDLAPVSPGNGSELKYTHFSVIQSASRRLPLLTAVNIDGDKALNLKRKGTWRLDGRLEEEHQIGNALYSKNPIDRGHLVRRMDPGWGDTREEAQQGELDSFHYTNSAPQHAHLNQRDWLGLEDYILGSATTRGFSACVMTGPVFRDSDPELRAQPGAEGVKIPREYWKVAAMVNDDTGALSVTGYVLSQGEMLAGLTEAAFILGEYKTYQVRLSLIESATGMDFGALKDFDPLAGAEESLFGQAAFEVAGPESLQL